MKGTNLECLRSLGDLPMFSLVEGPGLVKPAVEWAESEREEENYEVKDESYWYGRKSRKVIVACNMVIFREDT